MKAVCLVSLALVAAGAHAPVAHAQVQDIYRLTRGTFDSHAEYHDIALAPGQEKVLADITGPGKITYFYFTDFKQTTIYPGLVLEIYWDDARSPSVRVPLSDFFGALQSREVEFTSLPMQVNHHDYMSYLPMPFSKHARLVVRNDGDETYRQLAAWGVDFDRDPAMASEPSRLHATWSRSNPTFQAVHTLLDVTGHGQYIGNFYQVNSKYKGWWGEGNAIFVVDGKTITHAEGTEDEYGSTWGFGGTYSTAYDGYIENSEGRNRMYRWYLQNPVRFQKSLRIQMQDQRYDDGQVDSADDVTSIAYWYQDGAGVAPALQPFAERTAPSRAADYPPPRK